MNKYPTIRVSSTTIRGGGSESMNKYPTHPQLRGLKLFECHRVAQRTHVAGGTLNNGQCRKPRFTCTIGPGQLLQ